MIGGGGHARSVLDTILSRGEYEVIGYTDPYPSDIPLKYLGTDDVLEELFNQGVKSAAFGIGYLGKGCLRDKLNNKLKEIGFRLPVIIDNSAVIAQDAVFGEGTFVGKHAVINAGAIIGRLCIINTQAIIEHTNTIGDFSHVSVGAVLCGDVTVEDHCLVGANATVIQGTRVGQYSIIGAGAVVIDDVLPTTRVAGIPARVIGHTKNREEQK